MSTNKNLMKNFLRLKDDLAKEYPNMKLSEVNNENSFYFICDGHTVCNAHFPEIRICTKVCVYNWGNEVKLGYIGQKNHTVMKNYNMLKIICCASVNKFFKSLSDANLEIKNCMLQNKLKEIEKDF